MSIENILEKTLLGLGYECVDFELTQQGDLRVFIDKPEGITVDDCALVSNHLSRVFMVEEINYKRLEISSPGLDRVVKKEKDFVRFIGFLIKIQTRLPIENQKKFIGRIIDCKTGQVTIELKDKKHILIELSNIEKARLKPEF